MRQSCRALGAVRRVMAGPSLAQAQAGLAAAEAAAVEMEIGLTCAVVDAGGTLVALARMDNARYFTSDIALGKARASAAFGAPSARCLGSLPWVSRVSMEGGENLLFLQGALPITENGQPVGALGCSGAASEQDENAAQGGCGGDGVGRQGRGRARRAPPLRRGVWGLAPSGDALELVQAVGEFDVGAKWVGEERDRNAECFDLRIRQVECHARRLEPLAELLEILDFKSDVIQASALRCGNRVVGW